MNSERRLIDEADRACSRGPSRKRQEEYAQAKFAKFCGPKSVSRRSASDEIAVSKGLSLNSSLAHDQAGMARSGPSNSDIGAIDEAAIEVNNGASTTTRRAYAQTILAKRRVSKSVMRASAAAESEAINGGFEQANLAIDHDMVVKL